MIIISSSSLYNPSKELLLLWKLPEDLLQEESLTEEWISVFLEGLELWSYKDSLASSGSSHKHHADSLSLYPGQLWVSRWRVTQLQFIESSSKFLEGWCCNNWIFSSTQPMCAMMIHKWNICQHFYVLSFVGQINPKPNLQCSPSPKPQKSNSLE